MRKVALVLMVVAVFAAVLLPATAQALLQPMLTVEAHDGHAQMQVIADANAPTGTQQTAEYHFVATLKNGWNRAIRVTCNFRIRSNRDIPYPPAGPSYHNGGLPGTVPIFANVGLSTKVKPGVTNIHLVATNPLWSWGTVSRWSIVKQGCYKGPNKDFPSYYA